MKKIFFNIIKYLLTLLSLIVFYNVSMYLVCSFSSELIYNNTLKSSKEMLIEGNTYFMNVASQIDNTTDGLMINEAYSVDSNNPLESYLRIRKNYKSGLTLYELPDVSHRLATFSKNTVEKGIPVKDEGYLIIEELANYLSGKVQISVEYARYYHGYLLLYRPLLILTDIIGIRLFLFVAFTASFIVLAYKLKKELGKYVMFSICFPITLFGYFFISYSIQQAPIFLIMILYSIVITNNLKKWNWNSVAYSAMVVGSLTCFFDFLTTPTLTLAIPLLIYVLYTNSNTKFSLKKLFVGIFKVCILWGIGYSLTWLSKWIIYDTILNGSLISSVLEQIKFRSISFDSSFLTTSAYYIFKNISYISTITIVFILINDTINKHFKNKISFKYLEINKSSIVFVCCIPLFWSLITINHFSEHTFFAYRNLVLMLTLILMFYFKSQSSKS